MATFLLEVGTEELPATFIDEAIAQWQSRLPASLAEHSLTNDTINIYATPRRLAILIKGLPLQQPDRQEEIKGPPATTAFKNGKPTPAAVGFAKKQGVELDTLEIRPTDKGDFVFIRKHIPGHPTAAILTQLIPEWIFKLEGKRLMRWSDGDLKFPRPIRWLVALLDDTLLPIELVNGCETVTSDRRSQVHRVLHPQPIIISHAENYVELLASGYVDVAPEVRQTKIRQAISDAATQIGGWAEIPAQLLAEVTNLVEFPTAVVGKFDVEFLNLPSEVIKTVMVTHQRYFPIYKSQDSPELLPYFITISNGDPQKSAAIAAGNERVIRARLADGNFFYQTDLAKPLEAYLPLLEKVTFQEALGSMGAKVDRLAKNAELISQQLQIEASDRTNINRAALLCKADLVTQMVYEFPELQGIMGEKYALASGESEAVATGIFEHYLPRGAGDRLPQTIVGQVIAIADKIDTLISIFGLGMLPTGSSDPFALRRAANGIINMIWSADLSLNLYELIQQIIANHPKASPELFNQLQEFFSQRLRTLLQEEKGIDYDLVSAVLGENDPEYAERALTDLLDTRDRALFLQNIRINNSLDQIYETVNRSTRLAAQGNLDSRQLDAKIAVNPARFQKSCEQDFYDALIELLPQTQAAQASRNYQQLVTALTQIAPTVSNFFDGPDSVLVMDSDPEIKRNRLNLLGLLRNHARVLADFGPIVKT